jgi:hypothetical protein
MCAVRVRHLRCRTYAGAESYSIAQRAGRAMYDYETCETRSLEPHAPCPAIAGKAIRRLTWEWRMMQSGAPPLLGCQPVDTLAAVDKAVVDSWL